MSQPLTAIVPLARPDTGDAALDRYCTRAGFMSTRVMSCATICFQTRKSGDPVVVGIRRLCRGIMSGAATPTFRIPTGSASTSSWTRSHRSIAASGGPLSDERASRQTATCYSREHGGGDVSCRIHSEQAAFSQGQPGVLHGTGDAGWSEQVHPLDRPGAGRQTPDQAYFNALQPIPPAA